MQLWKPLALIVPAGLVLGMIGGHLARPEMQVRAGEPSQRMFETRAQRYGSAESYPAQPAYVGGYSYPPYLSAPTTDRSQPYGGPDWTYADEPLPTIAELDARQAALLADPDVEFAVSPPGDEPKPAAEGAPQPATQVALAPADGSPEPRTADGKLPAIW